MRYEAVIGLEIHAQLLTETKMFCGCSSTFGAAPNSHVCPVCAGMPGVLPVMNRRAVEYVIRTGLAMNCSISGSSRFARKNYFYPDLPKGYQISQYELPLCTGGFIEIPVEGRKKRIGLTRIHLEEDAGKNIHDSRGNESLVDLNRAGVPLMEIVSEPDIRSAREAASFVRALRAIVRAIGVCDGNMEQGSLRCDANVSVRPERQKTLGVKTEIKNMNSFKFIEKALDYEIRRQIRIISEGGGITQETRLWDSERGVTVPMRSKEEAHDYRYFPEPDLMPVVVDEEWISTIRSTIGELPAARCERFMTDFGMTWDDAGLLTADTATADWFEEAVRLGGDPKTVGNWMRGDLTRLLNEDGRQIEESLLRPAGLVELLRTIENGTISGKIAKTVFEEMYRTGRDAASIIREKGLTQITDESGIEAVIDGILQKNQDAVKRYRSGEEKLTGFFVGQVMKETKGKANPKMVNDILRKKLALSGE